MKTIFSQADFSGDDRYLGWQDGISTVSYTDSTHMKGDEWYDLLEIALNKPPTPGADRERSFSVQLALDKYFSVQGSTNRNSKDKDDKDKKEKKANVVIDALSLSASRLGILAPVVSGQTASQLLELRKSKGIVLIPDTNSLYNGTLHWLLHVLKQTSVWLMPFVMSLTQMQAREAMLKSLARSQKETNLAQALRSRAMVNAGLSFLERNQHRYQVLELDPSLLRYMRTAGKGGFDQDEGEVLEDRLLIEGVHSVLRSTRTRAKQVVVTSDVLLSRVLGAEGISNICLPTSRLGADAISSFRYDAWAGSFMGASLRGLLWDLAHTFGTVRIDTRAHSSLSASCYWPGKLPQDWLSELLDIQEVGDAEAEPKGADQVTPAPEGKTGSRSEPAVKHQKRREKEAPVEDVSAAARETGSDQSTFSNAAIPQSSLPLALRIAGALYEAGQLTFAGLTEKLGSGGTRPNDGNTRRSLEVIRRAELIEFDGETIRAKPELDAVESNLRRGELDHISHQFERFAPYRVVREHLREHGELARERVRSLLSEALGADVAQEASIRLVRYHVLLGQCWTDGAGWQDGSARPDGPEFLRQFEAAYEGAARDNIAQIADFLPTLCRSARMSPWGASRAVQEYARVLSEKFTFGYAVGGKPTGVDAVISGSLLELEEVPVPMDRFEIGGRPVFTLERVR